MVSKDVEDPSPVLMLLIFLKTEWLRWCYQGLVYQKDRSLPKGATFRRDADPNLRLLALPKLTVEHVWIKWIFLDCRSAIRTGLGFEFFDGCFQIGEFRHRQKFRGLG